MNKDLYTRSISVVWGGLHAIFQSSERAATGGLLRSRGEEKSAGAKGAVRFRPGEVVAILCAAELSQSR